MFDVAARPSDFGPRTIRPEVCEAVRVLFGVGWSYHAIGKLLRLDEGTVRYIALHPPRSSEPRPWTERRGGHPPLPEETVARVRALRLAGRTYEQIVEATGISFSSVYSIVKGREFYAARKPEGRPRESHSVQSG